MGHRALVAYRRPDHLYDLRYSHWGGQDLTLADDLEAATPLASGRVDAELLADSVAFEHVLTEYLDPCVHEALYLVSSDFEVTAYRVLWLEWGDAREQGRGAIVAVSPGERDVDLRGWFRGIKTTLADAIEMGTFSRRAAKSYLEARVCEDENGHVYTYGEAESPAGESGAFDGLEEPGEGDHGDDRPLR